MADETYKSGKDTYTIKVYPGPADGKKHPMILVVHGNFGLNPPFGKQIHRFAEDLAAAGYVTAVPRYYVKDPPVHLVPTDDNAIPHVPTLTDAIAYVAKRPDADSERLGLVGYSLGAATAMTYIASNPPETVKVLVDFFGPLNPKIEAEVARFPPTFIRHNTKDLVVDVKFSRKLDGLLGTIEHDFFEYDKESNFPLGHHPFIQDGPADKDSREKAKAWIVKHLKPVGK
jgi:carboxymethylenebutenolidase